ncbi:heme NO-binding protein [Wenzhouxiangella sp. C33]|uniref:Heme NO-binding protein n=2 Tax=Wenzhouxiangella limi TaxID=2707351 RepID=A0A845V504_9GAMM|nr:heme NO-binding protein [Wenzhouxiangella limi]
MVTEMFSEEIWKRISEKAGGDDVYVAMDPYPDEQTLKLVMAASDVLEMEPADVLKAFGKWWIGFAGTEYKSLLDMAGSTSSEFMSNVNEIHARVGHLMPELKPPNFRVEELETGSFDDHLPSVFELHYFSTRDGLFPMVHGMLEGVADSCGEDVLIEHLVHSSEGNERDIYRVSVTKKKNR